MTTRPASASNKAWTVIPKGWAGSDPGQKVWCRFPKTVLEEGLEGGPEVELCSHKVTSNLNGLINHIKNAHRDAHPDLVHKIEEA